MAVISKATKANWARLGTDPAKRLTKRANKKMSTKVFVPREYLISKSSKKSIEKIIGLVRDNNFKISDVVYTLCLLKLAQNGLCDDKFKLPKYISDSLGSLYSIVPKLLSIDIPANEFDFVGAVYQSLKSEGSKNSEGSYYTPYNVAKAMCCGFSASKNNKLLDPCCGTGAIFLAVKCSDPSALYGCDLDPIAVLVCKTNLFCLFPNVEFTPNIMCTNFLSDSVFEEVSFSGCITNPPWGASFKEDKHSSSVIFSNESSSLFLEQAIQRVKKRGFISFLLPKSILNIAVHSDIRNLILDKTAVVSITQYSNLFSGVTTTLFNLVLTNGVAQTQRARIKRKNQVFEVDASRFKQYENNVFRLLSQNDINLLERITANCPWNLSKSVWALGIVTGDNKNKLLDKPIKGSEPVYTGKEVQPFSLKTPNKYIVFDSSNFQQVAREEYYRAEEKLVYKFISKKLTFAIDNSGALCLNSANILIPQIQGLSAKTVAALLNSKLYRYLYLIMFDDPKILKGNLCKLPFPDLDKDEGERLDDMVDNYLLGLTQLDSIDKEIYKIFDLTNSEVARVRELTDGAA